MHVLVGPTTSRFANGSAKEQCRQMGSMHESFWCRSICWATRGALMEAVLQHTVKWQRDHPAAQSSM